MDVDPALQSQIRNIEATYGKPLDHWFAVIDASDLTKHNQVVAMLKLTTGSRTAPRAVMATIAKSYDLDYAWRAVGEAYRGAQATIWRLGKRASHLSRGGAQMPSGSVLR